MSETTTHKERRMAYRCTDFEIVEQGNLELPVSTPAVFSTGTAIDVAKLQNALAKRGYTFIAPHSEQGYLSSKVLASDTNEFFHIKATTSAVRIFPKDDEFSFETLNGLVQTIEDCLTRLELQRDEEVDVDA